MFAEFEWFEKVYGTVNKSHGPLDAGTANQVGECDGELIRRGRIRPNFYHEMEVPTSNTSMLAFEVFDRYGRLKNELKNHVVRKGSGVWDEELDSGDLLLIERIRIEKGYRRRGLGTQIVKALLDAARHKSRGLFAIVWPGSINDHELRAEAEAQADTKDKEATHGREEASAIRFWRTLGFRRIGSTRWFGLAFDADHPSHRLAAEDDYDPPKAPRTTPDSAPHPLQQTLVDSWYSDDLAALRLHLRHTSAVDPSWQATDPEGNTLLHLAGVNFRAASVEWIIEQKFGRPLLERRNNDGYYPLEAVRAQLEDMRVRRDFRGRNVPISDRFKGHGDAEVETLVALGAAIDPLPRELDQLAAGCTCERCTWGFLSPRMAFALLCQAEIKRDASAAVIPIEDGPGWVKRNSHLLEWVPQAVQENLKTNKAMRQGFVDLCAKMATCLRKGRVPNEEDILDAVGNANERPPATNAFLERGGSVQEVALMVFTSAMDADALAGNGEHEGTFSEEIAQLRQCRNDHEFGFVSGMCGYARISQWEESTLTRAPIDAPSCYGGSSQSRLLPAA